MKYLKISLISIALIGGFTLLYKLNSEETEEVGDVNLIGNTFIDAINQQIESIKNSSVKTFSKKLYEQTIYSIKAAEKNNKISKQWSNNLLQKAEFIYHDKFIKEANFVFSKSAWSTNDINYVKGEINRLDNSNYIKNKQELNKLNKVLAEYNSILTFLAQASQYSRVNSVDDVSDKFDQQGVQNQIDKALKMSKTTSLVKNNKSLIEQLNNVKKLMYAKHLDFLNKKFKLVENQDLSLYSDYNDYFNKVCQPMFNEITTFKNTANDLYKVDTNLWYQTIDYLSSSVARVARESKKVI